MEVAVAEEPQKKVFRARKTMKISDRQQLEFLHNSLPSSSTVTTSSTSHPSPPLVNGNHRGEDHPDSEKDGQSPTDSGQKTSHVAFPTSRSPSPLALSLSLSPSPPCRSSETKAPSPSTSTPPRSPKGGEKEEQHKEASAVSENGKRVEKTEKEELKKEVEVATSLNKKKNGHTKPGKPSKGPYVGLTDSTRKTREKQTTKDKKLSKKPMATEPPLATDPLEDDKTTGLPLNTPSPSSSHTPEPDQEVKEGFLVLSEEDENQAERDETKEKEATEEQQKVEEMKVETETSGSGQSSAAPHVSTSSPTPLTSGEDCEGVRVGLKRVLSKGTSTDGKLDVVERGGKRQKVDGEELEAQLELKISADAGRRLKLEKVVQQLVEEQLRVLQLTVFDRSLQELRERVEKMDCVTKHQHTLNTLQAKIARLAKKFGAANQTKESVKKPEVSSTAPTASTPSVSTSSATPVSRSPSRTTAESRQAAPNQPVNSVSSTACLNESKSLSTTHLLVSSATVPAPVVSLITTSAPSSAAPSASNSATITSQNQPGALMLKAAPASGIIPQSTPGSAPQAVPLQPLLIQLPLTVTNAQGGTMVANHSTGVELFPVTSLAAVSTSKTKTTTTFILQKAAPLTSVPPLTPIPSIAVARAVPPGGSGIVSTPASGVSVSSARAPTQAISVVGVTSSSFASSGPAATGGQSTGSAASGPTMASKTDNQPSSSSAKTPIQASRTNSSGAVIDLTEDDDDVQVTGVQKGAVPSSPAVSSSSSSSSSFSVSQRPVGAPPPLISANNMHASPTGGLLRSSPQTGQLSVGGSQVAVLQRTLQARLGNASSTAAPSPVSSSNPQPCPLPPLPSPPPLLARLPPEALHTSPPQQPQLKLARVQSQNGIVLSWCVAETDRSCAAVDSYHLYAYHQDGAALAGGLSPASHWKKIGEVKALPLPMACTLTQFVSGSTYYFAVRARDVYGRFGPFCDPQCTDVIGSSSSS
ncbi:activating transcription factor 7-interacting protein 1-like isoform X1 [Brienomyrus brachyistius]|nr:activating transcription factor 7-interacting protein 1-like isoform X1 [Brienomyrus brachyistius]